MKPATGPRAKPGPGRPLTSWRRRLEGGGSESGPHLHCHPAEHARRLGRPRGVNRSFRAGSFSSASPPGTRRLTAASWRTSFNDYRTITSCQDDQATCILHRATCRLRVTRVSHLDLVSVGPTHNREGRSPGRRRVQAQPKIAGSQDAPGRP